MDVFDLYEKIKKGAVMSNSRYLTPLNLQFEDLRI